MKNILCYGDSLTWGFSPLSERHAYEDRWPSVLNEQLGWDKARVINQGLNGRTTVFDDHGVSPDRNGARILPTILDTYTPLDLIIIMLGTNDLKNFICANPMATTRGIGRLIEIIKTFPYFMEGTAPQILVVSPPHVVATDEPIMAEIFQDSIQKSKQFTGYYAALTELTNTNFFDAASCAKASPIDGVHLDAKNTRAIGKNIAPTVAKILNI